MAGSDLYVPGSGYIHSHECDHDTPSKVFVNDVRIPVADVDIHIRNEGPLDISRYAEAQFISPYNGNDYIDVFQSSSPSDQDNFDTLRIDVLDEDTGEYHTEFDGVVTGVGDSSSGVSQEWVCRARGPAFMFNKIPATWPVQGPALAYTLDFIVNTLSEKIPQDVTFVTPDVNIGILQTLQDFGFEDVQDDWFIGRSGSIKKSFEANKHTLADVATYVRNKGGIRLWLQPTGDELVLIPTTSPGTAHVAHNLNQSDTPTVGQQTTHELRLINNDALAELSPVNTIRLQGQAKISLEGSVLEDKVPESEIRENQYLEVTARHESLVERAGGRELMADVDVDSDAISVINANREAKSLLKQAINEATGGDMETLLGAPLKPFDTITAKPSCDSNRGTNVPPITYEAMRVHHQIRPEDVSKTLINAGVEASFDDIEVEHSWRNF